ncbi:MAG: LpqB family beta-propeller domain-containing protein [Jiangellales bacterium]
MRRLVAMLVAVTLLVSGCVSVPTDGPVVEGRPAGEPVAPPNVAVIVTGPRPGDSPLAIVEGFLSSMASYEPGYPTSREYLTPEASAAWQPESGIAVYGAGEGSRNVSATDDGVTIALRLEASVGHDGSYTPAEVGSRLVLDLAVTQVDGEWRIDSPPDGLVMTEFDFNREFAAYASYFFDPRYSVLVPDLTYLPVRGNLPTLLVQDLLDGPTEWLDPGVRSALGPGVTLTSGSVVLSGTVAQVDLSSQVALASSEQRERLAAQLAWTLRQAPGVAEVAVISDGRPVPLPTSPTGVVSAEQFAFYDPAAVPAGDLLFAVADGRMVVVSDDGATPVAGPLGSTGPFRSVAAGLTATSAAAVSADGRSVTTAGLTDDSTAQTADLGTDLSTPSFDRQDRVWVVDRDGETSRVLLLDDGVEARQVPAGALEEVRVQRMQVAPDGVRLAAVYESEGVSRLLLALVIDSRDGETRIGRVRDLPLEQVEAVDVAWASATALALLAADAEDVQPFLVEMANAALSSRGQVAGAVSLAASPGQALVIGTAPAQRPSADSASADDAVPTLVRQDALQEWVPLLEGSAPTYAG